MTDPAAFSRIVVRAPGWLGDAILSLPAAAAIRRHFRSAHLAIAAPAPVSSLFREKTAVAPDDPAQDDFAVRRLDRLFLEPAQRLRVVADLEGRRHFGAIGSMAQDVGARPAAEREHHRVDDDGLARSRLAGECGEARVQLDLGRVDDGEVADLQVREHVSLPPRRSGRSGPSGALTGAGGRNRGRAGAGA